jgi:protein-L-isoaspartate O-methyltransferase
MGVIVSTKLTVQDFFRRVLPAFEQIPRDLFISQGMDVNEFMKSEIVSIEVVYSIDPLPSDHKVDFLLHPQMDGTKVTLGEIVIEKNGDGQQDKKTEILPIGRRLDDPVG